VALADDLRRVTGAARVRERVAAPLAERYVQVLLGDEPVLPEHLGERRLAGAALLRDERGEELRCRELASLHEDVAEPVLASGEELELLEEGRGGAPPELLLVLLARLAEAAAAVRAHLARQLGVVRAPGRHHRVELVEAVPARRGVLFPGHRGDHRVAPFLVVASRSVSAVPIASVFASSPG